MQADQSSAGAWRRAGWPERALEALGIALFLVTLSATLAGVFVRYFHWQGMEWSFEIAGLSFVWVTFIGCVLAEIRGENVRFVGLLLMLREGRRRWLDGLGTLVLLGVAAWLTASAWAVIQRSGHVPSPVLRWPSGMMSAALLSAAAMLVLIALLRLARMLKPRRAAS